MRKLLVIALTAMTVAGTASIALAATTLPWTGQGGENLPCDGGGHWVLTGKGVTSATMEVNGVTYTMVQNGKRFVRCRLERRVGCRHHGVCHVRRQPEEPAVRPLALCRR